MRGERSMERRTPGPLSAWLAAGGHGLDRAGSALIALDGDPAAGEDSSDLEEPIPHDLPLAPEIVHARVHNLAAARRSRRMTVLALPSAPLVAELRALIEASRATAARSLAGELIWLYWQVGHRLRRDVVGDGRAAYGEQVVAAVAASLSTEYGRGFSKRNLHHMLRFAEVFPDPEIVTALRTQLSWTHLRELIALDDPLRRRFYVELCRLEAWSTRTLQQKIAGMLYERTAIARRPEAVVEQALAALARPAA
jgi:hypothetical protein